MREDKKINLLENLKNWDLVDVVGHTLFYLASKNKSKLVACIISPHVGNGYRWLLRVANWEDFDRWSLAELQKHVPTFEDAVDVLTSLDIEQKLKDPTEN